jgi:uncharacterized membrane protein
VLVVSALSPLLAHALTQPEPSNQVSVEYLEKSRVTQASPSTTKLLEGTSINQTFQSLTIEILEGPDKGKTTTFKNDYTQLKAGDLFYVRHTVGVSIAFVLLLLLIGGFQGVRALASLAGSIVLIFYVLLPGIIGGVSPILVSVGVASLIIILGSYITHGFSRTTTVAMVSMIVTVVFTGIATYFVIHAAQLSGFTTEENAYLNFGASGKIDMIGLLFGGILIGLLGVLYDIAIGQAIAVEELIHAAAHYTKQQIFRRGMRIGREHIGALVNTLAIAYVGASLPLLLLFKQTSSASDVLYIINSERFATEIIRILMGSGGLVLAVPITTLLATYALHGRVKKSTGHAHAH